MDVPSVEHFINISVTSKFLQNILEFLKMFQMEMKYVERLESYVERLDK